MHFEQLFICHQILDLFEPLHNGRTEMATHVPK